MNHFLGIMKSDLAIVIYELAGILLAAMLCIYFNKRIKEIESEKEKASERRRYSELEESLKNEKRR
ncbi:MAG: hypothetical protein IJ733_20375 [Lachnospiraceae bacterium]|nr:hypothetical protein [Lachnospiraceae bacterium]